MPQVLPYRPEPYVTLAALYRKEYDDQAKCFAWAASGLAQGPPKSNALFLNSNVSATLCNANLGQLSLPIFLCASVDLSVMGRARQLNAC